MEGDHIEGNDATANPADKPPCSTAAVKSECSQISAHSSQSIPPDGGWGWVVVCASFITNAIVFGNLNTFGILYVHILEEYDTGADDISFKASFIGALSISMTFAMSPVTSIFVDRLGLRATAFTGAIIATTGMLASSFVSSLQFLYLTYGILLGAGSSMVYTPSMVILCHYFKRHLGIVNGIVSFGSAVSTMVLPFALEYLLERFGLRTTMQVLACLVSSMMICTLVWKPKHHPSKQEFTSSDSLYKKLHGCKRVIMHFFNIRIWKNRDYVIWSIAVPISFVGYFVPFVHLVKHTNDVMPDANPEVLVMCLGVSSGVSRLVCGKVADIPGIKRVQMQQCAFLLIGIATCCIPFAHNFWTLILIVLTMGICDGCFICLMGPIAVDLLGPAGAAQGLGCLFGLMSVPMTAGPPLAGLMYDHLHSYDVAFYTAGVPPILAAAILCLIPYTKAKKFSAICRSSIDVNGSACMAKDNLQICGQDKIMQNQGIEIAVVRDHSSASVGANTNGIIQEKQYPFVRTVKSAPNAALKEKQHFQL